MEHDEEKVTFAGHHIVVIRHAVEAVHQQAGDVADRFLAFQRDPDLLAHRR